MSQSKISSEQLSRYIEGDLSEAETRQVEHLLAQSPEARQQLESLRRMLVTLGRLPDLAPPSDFLEKLDQKLERSRNPWRILAEWLVLRPLPLPARAAAAVVLVSVATLAMWTQFNPSQLETPGSQALIARDNARKAPITGEMQKMEVSRRRSPDVDMDLDDDTTQQDLLQRFTEPGLEIEKKLALSKEDSTLSGSFGPVVKKNIVVMDAARQPAPSEEEFSEKTLSQLNSLGYLARSEESAPASPQMPASMASANDQSFVEEPMAVDALASRVEFHRKAGREEKGVELYESQAASAVGDVLITGDFNDFVPVQSQSSSIDQDIAGHEMEIAVSNPSQAVEQLKALFSQRGWVVEQISEGENQLVQVMSAWVPAANLAEATGIVVAQVTGKDKLMRGTEVATMRSPAFQAEVADAWYSDETMSAENEMATPSLNLYRERVAEDRAVYYSKPAKLGREARSEAPKVMDGFGGMPGMGAYGIAASSTAPMQRLTIRIRQTGQDRK